MCKLLFLWFVKHGDTIVNYFKIHREPALPWTNEIDRVCVMCKIQVLLDRPSTTLLGVQSGKGVPFFWLKDLLSYNNIVMCNKEIHEIFIQEGQVNCIFCNKRIQDPSKPKRYFCCGSKTVLSCERIAAESTVNITLQNILIFMGIDTGLERSLYITENIIS